MIYKWYLICNKDDFDALDLYSKEYEIFLEDIGLKTVVLTKGNYYSLLYEGVFLTYNINDRNPFIFEDIGILLDENNDFYLGVKQ
jgi:hypothetical protein